MQVAWVWSFRTKQKLPSCPSTVPLSTPFKSSGFRDFPNCFHKKWTLWNWVTYALLWICQPFDEWREFSFHYESNVPWRLSFQSLWSRQWKCIDDWLRWRSGVLHGEKQGRSRCLPWVLRAGVGKWKFLTRLKKAAKQLIMKERNSERRSLLGIVLRIPSWSKGRFYQTAPDQYFATCSLSTAI